METINDNSSIFGKAKIFLYSARFGVLIAVFGILLSFAMLIIQEIESRKQLENVKAISENLSFVQNSLTTKYLGEFPSFVDEIDKLLEAEIPNVISTKDTVVIFEDVLYYGIVSKPNGFKNINKKIFQLADAGAHIIVAHYHVGSLPFNKSIEQDFIVPVEYSKMLESISQCLKEAESNPNVKNIPSQIDDIMQLHFEKSWQNNLPYVKEKLDKYKSLKLVSPSDPVNTFVDKDLNEMCKKLDNVIGDYMKGYPQNIPSLEQIKAMYSTLTKVIASYYQKHDIEILPVAEYFTMSCWMINNKAIIGFPSKYGSKEIAFMSSDNAFSNYIGAILNGISFQR